MTAALAARGVATGRPDLWCTYAAIRTLAWLGRLDLVADPEGTLRYLAGRNNPDGGYAWSRGMASDAWATFYCTQAITDLGGIPPRPERTRRWLRHSFTGQAYGMTPGQAPDVWATHFSARVVTGTFREDVPDRAALLRWLGGLQTTSGGLTWTPAHPRADVRACYYGVAAWRALAALAPADPPWDVAALEAWLRRRQGPEGGFRFSESAEQPCMWATYRAAAALRALSAEPERPRDCAGWIDRTRGPRGGFVRWPGYPVEDVWAAFCAVGAARALAMPRSVIADAATCIAEMACGDGGYSYREPGLAADVLTTAAAVISAEGNDPRLPELRRWLDSCQLPNEGGVMYMPGRGAEVRCTLWAVVAGGLTDPAARERAAGWLASLQNPDGGFGFWEGRGSDLVSTAAAVEATARLGHPVRELLRADAITAFVDSCERAYDDDGMPGYGGVPGGRPELRPALHALHVRAALGDPRPGELAAVLGRHRVPGGGYANEGNRLPDLLSTYHALAAADRLGVAIDLDGIRAFRDRVAAGASTAWTPLAPPERDPLADCLGHLLSRRLSGESAGLPPLTLS